MHFSDQLIQQIKTSSPVVVGLDPNFDLMPSFLLPNSDDPDELCASLLAFSRLVIEATEGLVPAIKPQSAYYEQFGLAGLKALSMTIELARSNER